MTHNPAEALRWALEPFVKETKGWAPNNGWSKDDRALDTCRISGNTELTVGDLRRLQAAAEAHEQLLIDCAQIIDTIRGEWQTAGAWSEWDASVRARISSALCGLSQQGPWATQDDMGRPIDPNTGCAWDPALTSPAPAGGEGHAFSPSALPRVCAICNRDADSHGSDGWSSEPVQELHELPPPSPDVAGVVEADPVRRGRYSGLREAAMFTETLRDNCPAQDKRELLQEIIDEMEWRIEYYKRAARTALTPKEKA